MWIATAIPGSEGGLKEGRCNITSFLLEGAFERTVEEESLASRRCVQNDDHRLEESAIQTSFLPCALLGLKGICQVK